jgi:LmbE family N-acetylglucosaminyl deacetylase
MNTIDPPRIACIIPHPDDEIGMAGFILRANAMGLETHVVCVTAGGRVRSGKFRMPAGSCVADVRMEARRIRKDAHAFT